MNRIGRTVTALVLTLVWLLVGVTAAQVTLSGTVENWDRGEARIAAEVIGDEDAPTGTLAEGTIGEDGSFALELPADVPDEMLGTIDANFICESGGVTVEPGSFQGATVFGLTVYEEGELVGYAASASSEAAANYAGVAEGDFASFLVHADQAVTVRGTCTMDDGALESNDLDLQPGWNVITSTAVGVTEEGVPSELENVAVSEMPETVSWFFVGMGEE